MADSKEVFVKTQNISEKIATEKLKERLAAQKERRKFAEKLKNVKSIADGDGEEDTVEWYNKMKRIQQEKELAKKKAKLFEEQDKEFDSTVEVKKKESYTTKDLKGLAIGHKVDSFKEGHQIVLTLRDRDVLDDDEDVLENVNMLDDEKAAKNVDNKTKKPDYKPYDDDEFDEFGILKKSSLLSKYDEEIEGPKKEMFRIGKTTKDASKEMVKMKLEQQGKVTLQLPEMKVASEYFTPSEMLKFKKPKRKGALRKKGTIKKEIKTETEEEEIVNSVDHGSRSGKRQKTEKGHVSKKKGVSKLNISQLEEEDDILGPDEDLTGIRVEEDEAENELHSALSKARKLKLLDNKTIDPAENVAKMLESVPVEMKEEIEDSTVELNGNNIVLNSTAEFCRNLGELPTYQSKMKVEIDTEMEMDNSPKQEDEEGEDEDLKYRNNWNEVDIEMEEEPEEERFESDSPGGGGGDYQSQPILEEEPDVSVGVAGALKLAMNKGYLDKESAKPMGANRVSSVISAQAYTIEEKF